LANAYGLLPMMTSCRLFIDPPAAGAWNMAVDQTLLESAAVRGDCAWRIYRWQEPTLSLGYFQPYGDRQRHTASLGCPVVRRISGGGAILHDREITYSLVVPAGHRWAAGRDTLYRTVHAALVELLREIGIDASLCQPTSPMARSDPPFLCFQRRAAGDVLVGNAKIAGSAQRRMHRAMLQHGSVLLERSSAAPELPALADFAPSVLDTGPILTAWLDRLSRRLDFAWESRPLGDTERSRAVHLAEAKYSSELWNRARKRENPRNSFDSACPSCYDHLDNGLA